jgi:prepilin-type N-terminal cleavage/methylation domain-containing protein
MKYYKTQLGFSIIEVIIVIVTLGIGATIGVVGMSALNKPAKENSTAQIAKEPPKNIATDVPVAPIIDSVLSLDTANATLDDINLDEDSGDSIQLDNQTADF